MDILRIGEKQKFRDIFGGSWTTGSDSGDTWKVSASIEGSIIEKIEILEVCMFDEKEHKISKDLEDPNRTEDRLHYIIRFVNFLAGGDKEFKILTDGITWRPLDTTIGTLLWLSMVDRLKILEAIQAAHNNT